MYRLLAYASVTTTEMAYTLCQFHIRMLILLTHTSFIFLKLSLTAFVVLMYVHEHVWAADVKVCVGCLLRHNEHRASREYVSDMH